MIRCSIRKLMRKV